MLDSFRLATALCNMHPDSLATGVCGLSAGIVDADVAVEVGHCRWPPVHLFFAFHYLLPQQCCDNDRKSPRLLQFSAMEKQPKQARIQKLRGLIDWGRRVQFVYQVAGLALSASAWTAVSKFINENHTLAAWRVPISLAASAVVLLMFGALLHRFSPGQQRMKSEKEVDEAIEKIKLAGARGFLLSHFEARAIDLQQTLEETWHHWNNAGEKLIHPLDARLDKLTSYSADGAMKLLDERRDFMVLYSQHLNLLKLEFPEFASLVIEAGYPSDNEYPRVLANLKTHIETLREQSQREWDTY